MSKLSIRRSKTTEIPRPENARPLIVAAILTIIALTCGALALAGCTRPVEERPVEERQTSTYIPPLHPPISIDAPEGWRIFSHPEVLFDLQLIGPYGGLRDLEGIRIVFIDPDIIRTVCLSSHPNQESDECTAAHYRDQWFSTNSGNDGIGNSVSVGERIIGGLPAAGISYTWAESPDKIYSCETWYVAQNQGMWDITICSAPNESIPPELLDALDTITWTTPAPTTAPTTPTATPS